MEDGSHVNTTGVFAVAGIASTVTRNCASCGKAFEAIKADVARGGGKYCSRTCSQSARRTSVDSFCDRCGATFKVKPSKIANGRGKFCSRKCKADYGLAHTSTPLAERLQKGLGTATANGCLEWTGLRPEGRYGTISSGPPEHKMLRTHRVAYEIAYGPIPDGLHVLHKCDNPPCCNPEHLFLGSHDDNMKDMAAKKRSPHGEAHPHAKLTAEQVEEIKNRVNAGELHREVAADLGVDKTTVTRIVNGQSRSWG